MQKPPVVTNGVGTTIAGVAMVLIAGVGMFLLDQEVGVGLLALGLVFIAFGGRQHRSGAKSNSPINTRDL